MSTDRELLELAAKAADLNVTWDEQVGLMALFSPDGSFCYWQPQHDDGDALRLAVKLRLNINFEEWDGTEFACAVPHKSHQGYDEVVGDDEDAATRRAIVRAAAEVGRGLRQLPTADESHAWAGTTPKEAALRAQAEEVAALRKRISELEDARLWANQRHGRCSQRCEELHNELAAARAHLATKQENPDA